MGEGEGCYRSTAVPERGSIKAAPPSASIAAAYRNEGARTAHRPSAHSLTYLYTAPHCTLPGISTRAVGCPAARMFGWGPILPVVLPFCGAAGLATQAL